MQVSGLTGLSRPLRLLLFLSLCLSSVQLLHTQTGPSLPPGAQEKIKRMTPEEIDARLKELGITREEASLKAAAAGINLEEYLASVSVIPAGGKQDTVRSDTVKPSDSTGGPEVTARQELPDSLPLSPSGLPYFGYDLFRNAPRTFEAAEEGPVDPEYLLGSRDVLKVAVWGEVEFENEYTIDPEGRIFISTVGPVVVAGLTLEQAYEKLLKQMSRSYSGMISQPRTVWMDVSLARIRPKRIFVMGEVTSPGTYTVGSYATIFNSLYTTGGPTVGGTLRDIRLIRNGKVVARVDFYDYLLGAEESGDVRVQNNDIVFIPVRGKTVSIRGEVRRPAAYELKEDEDLGDLLKYAGGLLPEAYAAAAQVERIRPLQERSGGVEDHVVLDVDLRKTLAQEETFELFDGDNVQVFPVLDVLRNFAIVRGSVWRPGRYELKGIETVRDLVTAAQGIQPQTYLPLAHLIRFNEDEVTTRIITLDLGRAMNDPEYSVRLMPRDELIVYSQDILEEKDRFVTIRGAVKKPGQYPLLEDLSLYDLIPLAGGYTEDAEGLEAEVSRLITNGGGGDSLVTILKPSLPTEFLHPGMTQPSMGSDGRDAPFYLRHRDEILVRSRPNFLPQQNVTITGDVIYPGVYAIERRGEKLSDLLHRAGGPTSSAYLGGAEFYRKGQRVLLDFAKAYYEQSDVHDILVMGGDSIAVPARPHTVLVIGEVNKPGLLSFLEGDDVSDYLDRAGGLTDSAYYALLTEPTGETRKLGLGMFSGDPRVSEGSTIEVVREPPPPPPDQRADFFGTVKDIFALLASVAAVVFIVVQTSN